MKKPCLLLLKLTAFITCISVILKITFSDCSDNTRNVKCISNRPEMKIESPV